MHTCVHIYGNVFSDIFTSCVFCNIKSQKATTKALGCSGSLSKTIRIRFPSRETNAKDRHYARKLAWSGMGHLLSPLAIISVTVV